MNGLRQEIDPVGGTHQSRSVETSLRPLATLLVYTLKGGRWILPWSRFLSACHEGDELVLVFGELEVVIRGDHLSLLESAIAHCTLQVLRELPPEYRALSTTEPFITELTVRARHAGPL